MKTIDLLKTFTGELAWTKEVWSVGDKAFATNGHILIAVPLKFVDEELPVFSKLDPLAMFDVPRFAVPLDFQVKELVAGISDADAQALSEVDNCAYCGGIGECGDCDCNTVHECGKCNGSGIGDSYKKYAGLCGRPFTFAYLKLIFRAAELFNGGVFQVAAVSEDEAQPALFELGRIQIALMPCKRVAPERIIQLSNTVGAVSL